MRDSESLEPAADSITLRDINRLRFESESRDAHELLNTAADWVIDSINPNESAIGFQKLREGVWPDRA